MGPNLYARLYILRNIQLLFTIIYVVLMVYAALNPGKWLDLKEPLGFGCKFYSLQILLPQSLLHKSKPLVSSVLVSCSILTIIATVPSILGCYRFPAEEIRKIYHIEIFQTLYDSILFSLWVFTFVFMSSEHGNHDLQGLGDPPKLSWHFGTVLVAFETILFSASSIMQMAPHIARSLAGEDPFGNNISMNYLVGV